MKLLTMITCARHSLKVKYPGLEWKQYNDLIAKEYGKLNLESIPTQDIVGDFRVEYSRYESDFFGSLGKFDESTCTAKFWKGDDLLFVKDISGNLFILYGDGKTLEGTYYTTSDSSRFGVDIFNLNNELIRNTSIGCLIPKALKKVNDKYMVCNSSEPCTHSEFLGLIDMSLFFGPLYDNSHICINVDDDILPVETTPKGFIIKNIKRLDVEYPILPYEDVATFDFTDELNYTNNFEFNSDKTCSEFTIKCF